MKLFWPLEVIEAKQAAEAVRVIHVEQLAGYVLHIHMKLV